MTWRRGRKVISAYDMRREVKLKKKGEGGGGCQNMRGREGRKNEIEREAEWIELIVM